MEWVDAVIKFGGFIAAVIGIWKSAKAIIKLAEDMRETKEYVKKNITNVEGIPTIQEHCRENYLTGLRLTVMNKDMPLGERIAAGIKYIEAGGNGEVKQYLISELHINEIQNK